VISAIYWTKQFIAFAVILQTIELIKIKDAYSDTGVWRWQDLKKEFKIFSKFHQQVLEYFLSTKNFILLLKFRIILASVLLFYTNSLILVLLLITTVLIALRWRGTFNGGSDYVTVLILSALTLGSFFSYSEKVSIAILFYIAIQVVSSYFIAGLVKLRKANWRSGLALKGFISSTIFNDNRFTKFISGNSILLLFFSWVLIIFEISFVFTLFDPIICLCFLGLALFFHVGNFYIFGLNRFIFAWLSCYPALYFCSTFLS